TLDAALPEPGAGTFRASVSVAALHTTLLPAPPGTEQVSGGGLRVIGGGGVESASFADGTTRYTVIARIPAGETGGPALGAAGTDALPAAALAPYLALPALPPRVVSLARHIVAGAQGPVAEADALVRWLDSGRYRYSAQPPPAADPDPLSGFLFDTRTGFCQQFAGAFAALARAVGLPTRVAVGFGAGTVGPDGTVTVRASDAHTWPEVYFGPTVGWVSFEPTPGGSAPPASVRQGRPAAAEPDPTKQLRPGDGTTPAAPGSALAGLVPGATSSSTHPLRAGAGGFPLWPVLVAVALAVAAAVAVSPRARRRAGSRGRRVAARLSAWRRRARRRRGGAAPATEVLDAWRRSAGALARASWGRRDAETANEHATRLTEVVAHRSRLAPVVAGVMRPVPGLDPARYAELAALATKAVYGAQEITGDDAARAERLDEEVRARLDGRRPVPV
ncbi:MAG TPA: transglutaminase domain-containing protein, partial [Acidimicrobiales bacterium]|nr:transglutaminase domain-containing protein [Acidimicrobiales bacterium]